MISTLTKRRRYSQFGSTPSIGARWLPSFGAVEATPEGTPSEVFTARPRGTVWNVEKRGQVFSAPFRGSVFSAEDR